MKRIFVVLLCLSPFLTRPLSAQCVKGNCINGEGTYHFSSGATYIGKFRDGQINGYGICTYSDGAIYKGEWHDGLPHGFGKKTFPIQKRSWQGQWLNGQPVDKTGAVVTIEPRRKSQSLTARHAVPLQQLEGCIQGDCVNGTGTYVYRNQSARYEGEFRGEQAHGRGTIFYQNGEVYRGDWANDSFDGYGVYLLPDGQKISGYWRAGVHVGDRNPYLPAPKEEVKVPEEMQVRAVIIGVSGYTSLQSLRYTDDDAYRMLAFLRSPEGGALPEENIRVLVDEDATRNNILNAMTEVFTAAGPQDLILLYFSGHGLPGSFLPSDFDGFENRVYHDEVKQILDSSPAKYKICIADACHSGSLLTPKGGNSSSTALKYYETLAQSSPGSALILSSKASETSLEAENLRQGVFTHFLIRGMKGEADYNGDTIVSVQELFEFTYHSVRNFTGSRQSPVIKGNFDRNMPIAVIR